MPLFSLQIKGRFVGKVWGIPQIVDLCLLYEMGKCYGWKREGTNLSTIKMQMKHSKVDPRHTSDIRMSIERREPKIWSLFNMTE